MTALGQFQSKLTHKATARAKLVQDALYSIQCGNFLARLKISETWLESSKLPSSEITAVSDIKAFLRPILLAHAAAVKDKSRLAESSLADFFAHRTADGLTISPFWRFLHHGYGTVTNLRNSFDAKELEVLLARIKHDVGSNPPQESTVLRRAVALQTWYNENAPRLTANQVPVPPTFRSFLRLMFDFLDEKHARTTAWLVTPEQPQWHGFLEWCLDARKIDLKRTRVRSQEPEKPRRVIQSVPAHMRNIAPSGL